MMKTTMLIRHRGGSPAGIAPAQRRDDALAEFWNRLLTGIAVDDALEGSFPASDPPSWNPGIARPGSAVTSSDQDVAAVPPEDSSVAGTVNVSRPPSHELTFLQMLVSLVGAVGVVLLVPIVVLLVLLPISAAVRGIVEGLAWLVSVVFS
jgi:hypothetical protein